jgi:hypothetical protein
MAWHGQDQDQEEEQEQEQEQTAKSRNGPDVKAVVELMLLLRRFCVCLKSGKGKSQLNRPLN